MNHTHLWFKTVLGQWDGCEDIRFYETERLQLKYKYRLTGHAKLQTEHRTLNKNRQLERSHPTFNDVQMIAVYLMPGYSRANRGVICIARNVASSSERTASCFYLNFINGLVLNPPARLLKTVTKLRRLNQEKRK